ncbi:cbb3-type cytochrome oxidase subunit 3 [Dongia sp.]|uniref:cbb3-type cytochrome oxidase subunit 3 n=1 Tax=Dongia sp. TaxID=1977262 RepID=UPI0037527FBC
MTWLEISEFAKQFWAAWLMLVFLGIAFYAFRPKNREHFAECAKIPFKNERDEQQGPGA